MPYTVWGAFEAFRKDTVDISTDTSKKAKVSRNYLFDQLKGLNTVDSACPKIYQYLAFGSFSRRTKTTPLDDIDLLATVSGAGVTVATSSGSNPYEYWVKIDDNNAPLAPFRDDCGYVSSTKLLNQIKKSLGKVANYSKAEIKRNQQAVVLNLTSYSWVFDIVPALAVKNSYDDTISHYLIPDGTGDWIRTDPRRDTTYINKVNGQHTVNIPAVIRLLKYWNWRTHKPRLTSYYFETLCLRTFDNAPSQSDVPSAITYFFTTSQFYLSFSCSDPKNLGPNLDQDVSSDTKQKVKTAMAEAYQAACNANRFDASSQPAQAMTAWRSVFGPSFPTYG